MKKILVLLVFAIVFSVQSYAFEGKFTTSFNGKDTGIQTFAFNLNEDLGLRTGLGITINDNDPYISLARLGIKFNKLWGLYIDCDAYSTYSSTTKKSTNLLANYSITLKKSFSYKIVDNLTVELSLSLLKYKVNTTSHEFSVFSAIEPNLGFIVNL